METWRHVLLESSQCCLYSLVRHLRILSSSTMNACKFLMDAIAIQVEVTHNDVYTISLSDRSNAFNFLLKFLQNIIMITCLHLILDVILNHSLWLTLTQPSVRHFASIHFYSVSLKTHLHISYDPLHTMCKSSFKTITKFMFGYWTKKFKKTSTFSKSYLQKGKHISFTKASVRYLAKNILQCIFKE